MASLALTPSFQGKIMAADSVPALEEFVESLFNVTTNFPEFIMPGLEERFPLIKQFDKREWAYFIRHGILYIAYFGSRNFLDKNQMTELSVVYHQHFQKAYGDDDNAGSVQSAFHENFRAFTAELDNVASEKRVDYLEFQIGAWVFTCLLREKEISEDYMEVAHILGRMMWNEFYPWFRSE